MAIEWFTVLKSVPWTTVISNAPVVADGARKLWKTVASRNSATQAADAVDPGGAEASDIDGTPFEAQLTELQGTVDRLEQQMLASSELINALAEQNAQLIQLVEANRVRSLWLTRLSVLAAALGAAAFGLAVFVFTQA